MSKNRGQAPRGRGRRSGRRPDDQIGLGHIQPGIEQAGYDTDQPRIARRSASTEDQRSLARGGHPPCGVNLRLILADLGRSDIAEKRSDPHGRVPSGHGVGGRSSLASALRIEVATGLPPVSWISTVASRPTIEVGVRFQITWIRLPPSPLGAIAAET